MKHQTKKLQVKDCELQVTEAIHLDSDILVLVLHGGPGSGADPVIQLPAFQELENHFSMVYFDQRGSGKSEYSLLKGLTIEQITEDVKAVADYCKETYPEKHLCLWGGSFGGLLGLLFLARYPTMVEKAILSSPAINLSDKRVLEKIAEQVGNHEMSLPQQNHNLQAETLKVAEQYQGKERIDRVYHLSEFVQWISENPNPVQGAEGLWHFYAMKDWIFDCDMTSSIANLKVKTKFFMGMEDPFLPADILIQAVENYPNENVTLETFSPCGHGVFDDCKEAFCEKCIAFYQG